MKAKNPQMFKFIEQARKNKDNPQELFKEITKGYKPEQMEKIYSQAKQMGIPDDVLKQIK